MCRRIGYSEAFDSPKTMMLELPACLHADLESLAANEQSELSEVIARMVETVRQKHEADSPTRVVRKMPEPATDLGTADKAGQHDHYL